MTNTKLIQAIRKEIERRITDNTFGAKLELIDILAWLDTLESEKPMNPDDAMKELDEKIALVKERGTWDGVDVDEYMDEVRGREPKKPVPNDIEEAADEYAEKHGFRVPYDGSDNFYDDVDVKASKEGFIAGAKWQKEQMMKEAVEADVMLTLHDKTGDVSLHTGYLPKELGIKCNDKVRIIIVKED